MHKILIFLYRHLHLWVFLILEIGSALLLVNHNKFQQSIAFRAGTTVSAWCYSLTSSVSQYFGLNRQNAALAQQNADLMNENRQLRQMLELYADSISTANKPTAPDIRYIKARVIYNSVYRIRNHIIIDRGANHGIAPDMGVMSASGVVGIIERVSGNYSVVLPLINPEQRISAKIRRTDQLGSVNWNAHNPYSIQLEEVPAHATIAEGDTIVTTGFSTIFPEGEMIGVVKHASLPDNARFWKIDITPAVDFSCLDYVTVSAYTNQNEYKELRLSLLDNQDNSRN